MKNKKASIIIAIIMLIVGSIIFMRLKNHLRRYIVMIYRQKLEKYNYLIRINLFLLP